MRHVRERAAKGGHFIPDEDVIRRYTRSLSHLPEAIKIANRSLIYDNSKSPVERVVEAVDGLAIWRNPDLPELLGQIISTLG